MPFTVLQILCGIVLPATLVVVFGGLAVKFAKDGRWIFGPTLAIGFGLAYFNLEPNPGWPPGANVVYLLFYLPMVLGVLALVDALLRPPNWARIVVLAILWRMGVRLFLARQVPETLSATSAEMWVDLSTLVAIVWWYAFETMAEWWPGVTVPLLLAPISAASALVLALGWHIQNSGALAGAVMAMCCGGIVLGAFSSRNLFARGFAQMVVLVLQLLLVHGYFYTDDTLAGRQELILTILSFSPLLAFAAATPMVRTRSRCWQIVLRLVLVFAALGIVSGMTIHDYVLAEQSSSVGEE
jgi:hypothetical protein